MRFEWDDKKAEQNSLKHGISFEMASFAFDDPYALILDDEKHSAAEHRQWLIGDSDEKGSGHCVHNASAEGKHKDRQRTARESPRKENV